jgi:hypothetical protein
MEYTTYNYEACHCKLQMQLYHSNWLLVTFWSVCETLMMKNIHPFYVLPPDPAFVIFDRNCVGYGT